MCTEMISSRHSCCFPLLILYYNNSDTKCCSGLHCLAIVTYNPKRQSASSSSSTANNASSRSLLLDIAAVTQTRHLMSCHIDPYLFTLSRTLFGNPIGCTMRGACIGFGPA